MRLYTIRRITGAPNATCENWPLFVRHQSDANKTRQAKTTRGEEVNDWAPPPSSLSPGGVRIAALLLGAIEAHHEASSQLARASEVTWKCIVLLPADVFVCTWRFLVAPLVRSWFGSHPHSKQY